LWVAVATAGVYSAIVWAIKPTESLLQPIWSIQFAVFNTAILGLLVSFRTKVAYDRWWEGRLQWGSLINNSRNLCLKSREFVQLELAEREAFATLVSAFSIALRRHLRNESNLTSLPGFAKDPATPEHIPAYIAGKIIGTIARWRSANRLDGFAHQLLDVHAAALMEICGACERIRSTPLTPSYLSLLRHGLVLGFLFTPWALLQLIGPWVIVVQSLAVYFLFGIELTAEAVEQPFGYDGDDLPLEGYCETIEKNVREIFAS
jgi:putative membrane protein